MPGLSPFILMLIPDTKAKIMNNSHASSAPDGHLEPLLTAEQIAARVRALGAQISQDYAGRSVLLVGILKGAAIFLSDLARALTVDATFDFMAVSSYGRGQHSSGVVRLIKDLDESMEGRDVMIVEDILDTGLTLSYLRTLLAERQPASLKIAVLLDKPSRRKVAIEADYTGFVIADEFVVGYGLDCDEHYRNLPDLCILRPSPA